MNTRDYTLFLLWITVGQILSISWLDALYYLGKRLTTIKLGGVQVFRLKKNGLYMKINNQLRC
jgi:hypothetical protein